MISEGKTFKSITRIATRARNAGNYETEFELLEIQKNMLVADIYRRHCGLIKKIYFIYEHMKEPRIIIKYIEI